MLRDGFALIVQGLTAAISYADRIFSAMGDATSAIIAGFAIYTSYRFFLAPILGGSAGSDRAAKRYNKNNQRSKSVDGDATDWIGEI